MTYNNTGSHKKHNFKIQFKNKFWQKNFHATELRAKFYIRAVIHFWKFKHFYDIRGAKFQFPFIAQKSRRLWKIWWHNLSIEQQVAPWFVNRKTLSLILTEIPQGKNLNLFKHFHITWNLFVVEFFITVDSTYNNSTIFCFI